MADKTRTGAAESYLRRSLEAIFDIGRHILAKSGAMDMAAEYKAIARGLAQKGVIDHKLGQKLVEMAGYRNRLVHVTDEELHNIITEDLEDIKNFVRQVTAYLSQQK